MSSEDQAFYPFYKSCDCGHQMIMRQERRDNEMFADSLIEELRGLKKQPVKLCYVCFACGCKEPLPNKQFRLLFIDGVGGMLEEEE